LIGVRRRTRRWPSLAHCQAAVAQN